MKKHISATIDADLAERSRQYAQRERRSFSQVVELALDRYIQEKPPRKTELYLTEGAVIGNITRADTYGDR